MHPTLSPEALRIVKRQLIAAVRVSQDEPDAYLWRLADSVAFAGHPYGLHPSGTEAALTALDSAALARYAAEQMVTSRMLLVIVGNASRLTVEAAIARTFATLPRGNFTWSLPPARAVTRSSVALIQRPSGTNFILGLIQGPPASDPAFAAFRVATILLSSRIHEAVREKRGLSYAAGAPFIERGITTGGIYVTTTVPKRVMPIILSLVDSLRSMNAPRFAMQYFTDQFITDYFGENMTNADQADFLARAQLLRGDFHAATQAMETLRSVASPQVRAVVDRYFRNIQFVYLGDTARVNRSDFTAF
ncbi:MAG: hypothetical protein NVS4B3_28840 [Gemmatimonadaceae bacterium]